jgi:hypothetical protein
MVEKAVKISVQNSSAEYNIKSEEIKTIKDKVLPDEDVEIEIKIGKMEEELSEEIVKKVKEDKKIVVDPVSFNVSLKTKDKEVKVHKFNDFVERSIKLKSLKEDDVKKISTAVVINEDGFYTHVPTFVKEVNGEFLANIKSLTNSTYAVVSNLIEVDSVKNHWAKEVVNKMASKYILKDLEEFNPDEDITRAEFAEYIISAVGLDSYKDELTKNFSDVDKSNKSIYIAAEYGIVDGYEDNSFKPNQTITREEAMTMYARTMDLIKYQGEEINRLDTFKDKDKVSNWALEYVEKTVNGKLFNGRTAEKLVPNGNLTHAESLKVIDNLLVNSNFSN